MDFLPRLKSPLRRILVLTALYVFSAGTALSVLVENLRSEVPSILSLGVVAFALASVVLTYERTLRTLGAVAVVMLVCFLSVASGAYSGFPFGEFAFTSKLGPKVWDVPLLVPLLWLAVLIPGWVASERILQFKHVVVASIVVTAFDAVLELGADSLDLWHWKGGVPTELNYISWFLISALCFTTLKSIAREKEPHWIVPHLLIAQLLFYFLADLGPRILPIQWMRTSACLILIRSSQA